MMTQRNERNADPAPLDYEAFFLSLMSSKLVFTGIRQENVGTYDAQFKNCFHVDVAKFVQEARGPLHQESPRLVPSLAVR